MYDPINAFYEIIYHVVIICTGNVFWKSQEINENNGVYRTSNFLKILKKNHHLLKNIVLTLMLWKRSNLTQRIARVSVRQGPSFTCGLTAWLFSGRDPRNSSWTICILTLSSNLRKSKIRRFVHTGSYSIRTGFKNIYCCWPSKKIYSYRILYIRAGSEFILTRSYLFVPDPNLFLPGPIYSCQIQIY